MAALDAIAGIATSAADAPDAARTADDAARTATTRATEAIGFDLLFAALLGSAQPTADAATTDTALADQAVTSDDAALLADGARTAESASYAARRAGIASASPWLLGAPSPANAAAAQASITDVMSVPTAPTSASASDETRPARGVRTGASSTPSSDTDETAAANVASTPVAALEALVPVRPMEATLPPAPIDVPAVATSSHAEALASVAPALRGRLQRVIDRMEREFGHEVRIVEGRRSQARQDALFAQGRTTPGPVVTWTRDSAHLDGEAVDVMIDGGYENTKAFRTLARIAKQEGLRTLGPKDPGHLELSADAQSAPSAAPAMAAVASVATAARVARPASVAAPAAVASAAEVARVATPGAPRAVSVSSAPAPSGRERPSPVATEPARDAAPATRESARPAARERVEELVARLAPPLATGTSADAAVTAASAVPGVDLTARLEAIARVREAQATQPLSRLVMDVPDAVGGVDRIAVALRGQRLDASLAIQDPGTAARVAQRVEALAEALGARGYEPGTLAVSAARGIAPESLDLTRLTGLAMEREGTRGVASFLQDLGGGGLRDRQHSPGRHHDSSASSRGDEGERGDTPRRQPRRDPGDR